MSQRIIFFTEGATATAPEIAEIAAINAMAVNPYELLVLNSTASPNYGAGAISADYVAGTLVAPYNVAETYPVFDYENPPDPVLIATKATITDNVAIQITDGDVTFQIAANAIESGAFVPDGVKAFVSDNVAVPITDGEVTFQVAVGAIDSGAFSPTGTKAFVTDSVAVPVTGGSVTFTVVAGEITAGTYTATP